MCAMIVPSPASEIIRQRMRRQRQRDTLPEMQLRRRLHALGLRYRVDFPLFGTRRRGDVVFTSAMVAVFVDGCFWHRCPEHATMPKKNTAWWASKLAANVNRDRDTDRLLFDRGWQVIRVWSHEDMDRAADRIATVVDRRRKRTARTCG